MTAASRLLTDDLGTEVTVASPPRRLVSLVPNLTETLWWWGLGDRVVGRTDYCTAPPRGFPHATTVRGTKNPDVRAIVALAPDLVIANEEENRPLDVQRLRDAGVAVWVTRVRTLADAQTTFETLGEALGVPAAGRDLATALARVDASRPDGPTLDVAVPIWRGMPSSSDREDDDGWMTVGAETVSADVLAAAGLAVWPAQGRYPQLDRSELVAADLAAVLLTDEPYAFTAADGADLPGHRIRHVDGTGLFWWGPRTPTVVGDLRRLARTLRRRPR